MSVYQYRKFKITLSSDTKKTQGLRTGDIVRRQYFDGTNLKYTLMCVLSYGIDSNNKPYFIGAMLEGDAPTQNEILDFARTTNLFDSNRSGALYLTASDNEAPYMDVIDGTAQNLSLSYPSDIFTGSVPDSLRQYVFTSEYFNCDYIKQQSGNLRICHLKRNSTAANLSAFVGIVQEFYTYIANPNRVLISYKIKASKNVQAHASLEYSTGNQTDGSLSYTTSTAWEYKFHVITVEHSGRHLRQFKLDFDNLVENDEIWVSDLNIILLSSVANFSDSSKVRVGKLDGVSDSVFGKLNGYGGYMQKLFASGSAHVSGTLTAGDENGFAATFYAGKIHKNAFLNSISINFISAVTENNVVGNPTGVGKVYEITSNVTMIAQTNAWFLQHIGEKHCLSFYIYAKTPCQLAISQNSNTYGTITVSPDQTHKWFRCSIIGEIQSASVSGSDLTIGIAPTFLDSPGGSGDDEDKFYLTAPQLESGDIATQYQPTDSVLDYGNEYGAWFSRGGIGGTIQNPLLKLNFDGDGSIGARGNSFLIRNNGSGHLANGNISWDANGNVVFSDNVKMTWDQIEGTPPSEFIHRSVKIIGEDTFTIQNNGAGTIVTPETIILDTEETNLSSLASQRQWYYFDGLYYYPINGANARTLSVTSNASYWDYSPHSLTLKYEVNVDGHTYSDTITIKKQLISGYELRITSQNGTMFDCGNCQTILTATVYYQGVPMSVVPPTFKFLWKKYTLPNTTTEVSNWWAAVLGESNEIVTPEINRTSNQLILNYTILSTDMYVCELSIENQQLPYYFPIIL